MPCLPCTTETGGHCACVAQVVFEEEEEVKPEMKEQVAAKLQSHVRSRLSRKATAVKHARRATSMARPPPPARPLVRLNGLLRRARVRLGAEMAAALALERAEDVPRALAYLDDRSGDAPAPAYHAALCGASDGLGWARQLEQWLHEAPVGLRTCMCIEEGGEGGAGGAPRPPRLGTAERREALRARKSPLEQSAVVLIVLTQGLVDELKSAGAASLLRAQIEHACLWHGAENVLFVRVDPNVCPAPLPAPAGRRGGAGARSPAQASKPAAAGRRPSATSLIEALFARSAHPCLDLSIVSLAPAAASSRAEGAAAAAMAPSPADAPPTTIVQRGAFSEAAFQHAKERLLEAFTKQLWWNQTVEARAYPSPRQLWPSVSPWHEWEEATRELQRERAHQQAIGGGACRSASSASFASAGSATGGLAGGGQRASGGRLRPGTGGGAAGSRTPLSRRSKSAEVLLPSLPTAPGAGEKRR